jgi:hypothetical protein
LTRVVRVITMWRTAGVAESAPADSCADIPEWSEEAEAVLTDELSAQGLIGDGVALDRGFARRLRVAGCALLAVRA